MTIQGKRYEVIICMQSLIDLLHALLHFNAHVHVLSHTEILKFSSTC